jgi:imidazolonepropionase-like amidohydrolase
MEASPSPTTTASSRCLTFTMKPIEAIQAATTNGAELLGWSKTVGTVEVGRFADIIAVEGDPLADISVLERVHFVMKGGKVVRNDSAQK